MSNFAVMTPLSPVTRRRSRLLIVEDEPDLAVLIELAARRAEVFSQIEKVADGDEALALVRAGMRGENGGFVPDVIFTDYNMARVNGVALAAELRRDPATRGIAVALFTASSGVVEQQARQAGCCAHFLKPLGLHALTEALRGMPAYCRDFAAGRPRSPFVDETAPGAGGDDAQPSAA
jgi:CheY-like chemotaxis protein